MAIEIKHLKPGDDALVADAGGLFDDLPRPDAVRKFLAEPTHHLLIAYADGQAVGFVSGVELTHPDKGTEMFLYELAVDEDHRQRGFGTALVQELGELARSRGCNGMWVLADDDNAAAAATYRKAGGEIESQPVMFSWRFAADEER
jgi:ribosomal protein S18 acetylase RimI-like enzyme